MTSTSESLAGLRVIDLTSMIAGPIVGKLFAELGADVIHVEPPQGDDGRNSTTPFLGREGILYSMHNRSKRGISLNLRTEAGRNLLKRLVETADVFVENTSGTSLARYGLGYSDLSALNPRLVYVSITGWGLQGPRAGEPGYDILIQAFSGAMKKATPDGPPAFSASLVADPVAPLIAAFATMVALRNRDATGRGSHVTTSLLQAAFHQRALDGMLAEGDAPAGEKAARTGTGGLAPFVAADGEWVVLCAWTDDQFRELCKLIGFEFGLDEQFATRAGRSEHAESINEVIAEWVAARPRQEVIAELRDHGIPVAAVQSGLNDLMNDPHVRDNEMVIPIDHPTKGRFWQFALPFEIDGERGRVSAAPVFGEHTTEILRELGESDEHIAALRAEGAVQ